ncbi:MAG: epoxyqueuosine reductase QueH [Nitrospirae bacterium]|nr:epoxyqueuosine reductase QueH [Nitrospirota bacterium]
MHLLMHICCANCALYPLKTLENRGIEVRGLWYNPNIHPYTEYRARLGALKDLQESWKLEVEYVDLYGVKEFIREVSHREDDRCSYCYRTRLEKTALTARDLGMDGFTTSLLVSPYQEFDRIVETGRELAERYGVEFIAEDFRPGWREGVKISRELGLYRQKYCGCIYSEMERYTS